MGLSVGFVTALFVWSIVKVLTTPEETEKVHNIGEETPDMNA